MQSQPHENPSQASDSFESYASASSSSGRKRIHLTSALAAANQELDAVLTRHGHLEREIGNPVEIG
jgi:hypothetical protein